MAVKLMGAWPSPFAVRARIALNLKSVDYEYQEEDFRNKSELLLKSNPVYKKIPVLLHDDKPICESMIIVSYIDEVWTDGPSLLPSDPYDRAIARFWAYYVDDKWFPALVEMAKAKTDEAKKEATEKVLEGLKLFEEAFEKCSKGKQFFNGENIGYLDVAIGCYLGLIKMADLMTGLNLLNDKTPLLAAWAERFCASKAVKDVMPDPERLLEFVKVMLAAQAAQ
ncbi:Glutathione S-transferase U17 [Acorus gramineus]|uniref:glutathione transferase n=1 Tax=Acorus gramineus TaxID=55184 RepID=A0AAV9ATZ1_ACOGR|nr:Glutathione S-transferase U17 [Acorus gramineus]